VKVRVRASGPGTSSVCTLLGGLLAAAGHQVAFSPQGAGRSTDRSSGAPGRRGAGKRQLRIVLPGGWLATSVCLRAEPSRGEDLLLSGGPPGGGAKAWVALLPGVSPASGREPGCLRAVALMNVVQLESGEVELASRRSCLLLEASDSPAVLALADGLRDALQACGQSCALEVSITDDIAGCADSWFLSRLLQLPFALCHSTWDHFLSYPQGREIARHVLEEGLQVLGQMGRAPAALPCADPQELLEALSRGAQGLEALRFVPGREWGEPLQGALRGERVNLRGPNEMLVRLAAGAACPWNWRLARKHERLQQGVFYRSPADLYEAIV